VLDYPKKNSCIPTQAHRELVVSSSETEITRERNTHVMALHCIANAGEKFRMADLTEQSREWRARENKRGAGVWRTGEGAI
jgi:hypothetical protein